MTRKLVSLRVVVVVVVIVGPGSVRWWVVGEWGFGGWVIALHCLFVYGRSCVVCFSMGACAACCATAERAKRPCRFCSLLVARAASLLVSPSVAPTLRCRLAFWSLVAVLAVAHDLSTRRNVFSVFGLHAVVFFCKHVFFASLLARACAACIVSYACVCM